MFDIGFSELLLIALVALLVMGPERLPETVRSIALWIGRLKQMLANARKDVDYFRQMAIAQSAAHQIADGVFATVDAACDKGDPQGMVLQLVDLLARNPQAKA